MQDTTVEICKCFEAELAAMAALDRAYYLNPAPTSAERAEYAMRQDHLELQRARFYEKLSAARQDESPKPGIVRLQVDDRLISNQS
jgi:hypothetical protein